MSGLLSPKEFDETCLAAVERFDCGNSAWATTINHWIKSEDALQRVRKKNTKIWLYHNQSSELIGYGSLGITKWPIFSIESRKPVLILPNLGVQRGNQRQGYGKQICTHLIEESQKLYLEGRSQGKTLLPFLGLLVHPDNTDAIGLYKSVGFSTYDHYFEEDSVRYIGMAKLLDYA
jgi:ribosomal protein S18 acetylase RimI-like enzyme